MKAGDDISFLIISRKLRHLVSDVATLLSQRAASMIGRGCIRAKDRRNSTFTLKRFKGSKRVWGKRRGTVRIVAMVTMTSPEVYVLYLNRCCVCGEVKANNCLETTERGTFWNLSDTNVALRAPGHRRQIRKWSFFLFCCLSLLPISLSWVAIVTDLCYVNALITLCRCKYMFQSAQLCLIQLLLWGTEKRREGETRFFYKQLSLTYTNTLLLYWISLL